MWAAGSGPSGFLAEHAPTLFSDVSAGRRCSLGIAIDESQWAAAQATGCLDVAGLGWRTETARQKRSVVCWRNTWLPWTTQHHGAPRELWDAPHSIDRGRCRQNKPASLPPCLLASLPHCLDGQRASGRASKHHLLPKVSGGRP